MVLWISRSPPELESYLFVPTASISSMKTMEGACSSATRNSSLTSFGPSPKYFWMSSDPTTLKKVADVYKRGKILRLLQANLICMLIIFLAYLVGNSFCQKSFAGTWRAVKNYAFGRTNPHFFIVFRMSQR